MNALMPTYTIDKVKPPRVNMTALADTLKDADNIEGLTPIDIDSPDHLKNYFANGAYVREMSLPANTAVVGRIHKHETINILLEGEIVVVDESGNKKHLKAPHVFVAPAGNQKAAMTITPVRWLNSFACETTDPKEALDLLTCETMTEYNNHLLAIEDKKQLKLIAGRVGLSSEQMNKLVNTDDLTVMSDEYNHIYIKESDINGLGLFSSLDIKGGDIICPMRIGDNRTIAGRYSNHSSKPNAKALFVDGKPILYALTNIGKNEEITCDYNNVLDTRIKQGDL